VHCRIKYLKRGEQKWHDDFDLMLFVSEIFLELKRVAFKFILMFLGFIGYRGNRTYHNIFI